MSPYYLCSSPYIGGSSTTRTTPASVCLIYCVSISFTCWGLYTPPTPFIRARILSPRRDPNAYSSLTAWSWSRSWPPSPSSSSPSTLMLVRGSEDAGGGRGLAAASGLANGCARHGCGCGSGVQARSSRGACACACAWDRDRARTSPSSVRFSSVPGTPYAPRGASVPFGDTTGDGSRGRGGSGSSARACRVSGGLCDGTENAVLLGDTNRALEVTPLSRSLPNCVPNSSAAFAWRAEYFLVEVVRGPETRVLAIVIPAVLLFPGVECLLEMNGRGCR